MPHLPYPRDRLRGPHNRGGAGSTEGTGRGRRPNELASSDPWYREPLDVDQALGDVVEPIARLTTRGRQTVETVDYRYCITDGCLVLAHMFRHIRGRNGCTRIDRYPYVNIRLQRVVRSSN